MKKLLIALLAASIPVLAADQNDIAYRLGAGSGALSSGKISELTEQESPVPGDWVLCERAAGGLRKCDAAKMPVGTTLLKEWIEIPLAVPGGRPTLTQAMYFDVPYLATVTRFRVVCKTAPSVSSLTLDLRRSATWGAATFSVLTSALSLTESTYEASTTSFSAPNWTADDMGEVLVNAVDSGATAADCVAIVEFTRS